jgi:hypothetical protein
LNYSRLIFSFFISIIVFCFISCDDGNIITTTFDFDEDTDLSLCQQDDVNVLYFIDQDTNEAISFKFSTDEDFDGTFNNLDQSQTITLDINSTNEVVYRRLSASINGNSYFCQQIPPSDPQVLEEFVSTTGGTVTLEINAIYGTAIQEDDDDGDGVSNLLEDLNGDGNLFDDDTDGDGIPDFLDEDDDNDNVPTSIEAVFETDENDNPIPGEYVNTDGDDDLNYLDTDDDGDGILTINEDLNYCEDPENPSLNPTDDRNVDGLPNYLNPDATESTTINVINRNTVTRSFFTQVVFNDITFNNQNNDESLSFTSFIMGRYETSVSQDLPFNDTVTSIDEVGNICQ